MTSTDWSPTTKRLVAVGLIVLVLVLLFLLRDLIPPVLLGAVLAYLLKPVVDALVQRARLRRMVATILVFLILLFLISLVPVVVIPYLLGQIALLSGQAQQLVNDIARLWSQPIPFMTFELTLERLVGNVPAALQNLVQPVASQTVSLLVGVASSLLWVGVILVIAFYLVLDADRFRAYLDGLAPSAYADELRRLREEVNSVWRQFFRGQVVLGLVVGLAVWIATSAVGLPNAGLLGIIAGFLEVIPNFGPILAAIPGGLTALLRGSSYLPLSTFWFVVLVLALYTLIQWAENAYLVPRVMGRRLKIHPVVVFVGVLAGGRLLGAVGVLLAAPIIGMSRVLLKYVYARLLGQQPYPVDPAPGRKELYAGEIDAILFDLDGTLIETDDDAVQLLAKRLHPFRRLFPRRDPERVARRVIMALDGPATRVLSLLDRAGLDDKALGLASRLHRVRGAHPSPRFRAVAGIGPMLHDLARRYRLAIVTTRSHREAEAFLAGQGLGDLFQVITGRDDLWRIKPHPGPIQQTARLLGVPVQRCVMVGDTWADVQSAQAAGARTVGVLCGFGDRRELETAGADLILEATPDIVQIL